MDYGQYRLSGHTDFIELFNKKIDFKLDPMLVKLKNIGGEFAPALKQKILDKKFNDFDEVVLVGLQPRGIHLLNRLVSLLEKNYEHRFSRTYSK